MAIGVLTVVSFAWTYVVPILRDGIKVINKGTYGYIRDRVDDADILPLKGFEKRTKVYADAVEWLEGKGVDTSLYSSVLIYLLLEIAVANLKKKQKKLINRNP
jgi:hypothetical protein